MKFAGLLQDSRSGSVGTEAFESAINSCGSTGLFAAAVSTFRGSRDYAPDLSSRAENPAILPPGMHDYARIVHDHAADNSRFYHVWRSNLWLFRQKVNKTD